MYKLLIVDDEYIIRHGIANGIQWSEMGFEVYATACNGREALDLISNSNVPDVVITDIRMPVMDGIDFLKALKDLYPSVKAIVLSGYNEFEYAQKAIEYGVYSYILKPIRKNELCELFEKLRSELNCSLKVKSDALEVKNNMYSGRFLLAQHLYNQLVCGFSDNDEVRKELKDLGIEINEEIMCVAAFSYELSSIAEKESLPSKQILYMFADYWNRNNYPAFIDNSIIQVIIHSKKHLYLRDIRDIINDFKRYITDRVLNMFTCSIIISGGIGNAYSGLNNLKLSSKEAVQALQYNFFSGKGYIHYYGDIKAKDKESISSSIDKNIIDQIAESILEVNVHMATVRTRSLLKGLFASGIGDRHFLFLKCIEIYISVCTRIESGNFSVVRIYTDEMYFKLTGCKTFDELTEYYENCMAELCRQVESLTSGSDNNMIIRIKKYINDSYTQKITLQDIANNFYMNPSYLGTLFKEKTGINISDYILNIRMENAKKLLRNSDFQINDIAEKVGYTDYRHFCTIFKKVTGTTPLKYRLTSILK